jgi:hypothetical protein
MMPEQDLPSDPKPNADERADREERSSGQDEGDHVEGDAQADADDAERDSGPGSNDA